MILNAFQSTTKCERVEREVTKTINVQKCGEQMINDNFSKRIKIPCQKKIHRKQCLLSKDAEEDQGNNPADEGKANFHTTFNTKSLISYLYGSQNDLAIYFHI